MSHRIECADAFAFLRSLPDASVGLILTDPPYFRVKPDGWDRQWDKVSGFVEWLAVVADEWARVLKPNGTLVCFAGVNPAVTPGASTAAHVEVMLGGRFDVVASVTWVKADAQGYGVHNRHSKAGLRSHAPQTERAIVCEHYHADNIARGESTYTRKLDELRGFVFEPLRAYLDGERERAGVSAAEVNEATCSQMAGHWFTRSQWALPTRAKYAALRELFNRGPGGEHLRREYEGLRREYEGLRRPFEAEAGRHFTDVWTYHTVPARDGKHPCEKPREMAEDLVRQCSRPGDVVLDTFAGSGVFLSAAARLGRIAWGCDFQARWALHVQQAVAAAAGEMPPPAVADSADALPGQLALL